MASFLPNEEDALGATNESVELDESTSMEAKDFGRFGKRVLWTQALIVTLPSCLYLVVVDNLMISYGVVAIAQIWFVTLVAAATFPLKAQQSWRFLAGAGLLGGALPLVALVREVTLYCGGQRSGAELFLCLGYNIMALLILGLQIATARYIRLCVQQVCEDKGFKELQWVTIQCIEGTLKTGIIQVALLATLLVGSKTYSNQDNLESMEILLEREEAENANGMDIEDTSRGHDPEDVFDSFVLALRATLAGLALNVFLVKGLVAKHISKLLVVDFIQGSVTWQEYTSLGLQLLVFASVSAIVSMSPKDILIGNQSFNLYQALLIFGVCAPCIFLWIGLLQYCRSWRSNGGPLRNESLAKRQRRVSCKGRPLLDKGGESCQTVLIQQSQRTELGVDVERQDGRDESPRIVVKPDDELEPEIVVEPTKVVESEQEREPEIIVNSGQEDFSITGWET